MEKSGIYKITCLSNNRFYIGSSSKIFRRWKRHVRELKQNKHGNTHMQRAWLKYSENNFEFSIIEECSKDLLIIREDYYLQELKPFSPNGFNIALQAKGGDNITMNPRYNEICENISKGGKARFDRMSDEEKKKMSENQKGDKNGMFNKHHSNKTKETISMKNKKLYETGEIVSYKKGKKHSEIFGEKRAKEISEKLSKIASERIGDKNSFYGKEHSKESKDKIRKKAIGRKPTNCRKIKIDNIEYPSVCEAHRSLNIHPTTIVWRLRSVNFPNYSYLS